MAPKFGTSGLRGLVTELTEALVTDHVRAFIATCPIGTGLYVARDLRPSSPAIADTVIAAARGMGLTVTDCEAVPTPALALAAMGAGAAAVMVTGSHIPADRNGLKFYTPAGEITKQHEMAILSALGQPARIAGPSPTRNHGVGAAYVARYVTAFGAQALSGRVIGNYSHSTVGRDLLTDILTGLGARVIELGRSDQFIPVDTEAVDPATRAQLIAWADTQTLDAIVSMDGDGDRPLLTDAHGHVIPGDILGQITGAALGATVAVTPISSNTGAASLFETVMRTRIGSPHVIAAMETASASAIGYEANGGFLLGYTAHTLAGPLPALMTRDAVLPIVMPLVAAKGLTLAALVADQPARFTAADRVQDVAREKSLALIDALQNDTEALTRFTALFDGKAAGMDMLDGLRITLTDTRIVHLRPSGNAPELRLYVEGDTPETATTMLTTGLHYLSTQLAS